MSEAPKWVTLTPMAEEGLAHAREFAKADDLHVGVDHIVRGMMLVSPLVVQYIGQFTKSGIDQLARDILIAIVGSSQLVDDAPKTVEMAYTLAEAFVKRGIDKPEDRA